MGKNLSFFKLQTQIRDYGYEYSLLRHCKYLAMTAAAVWGLCILMGIHWLGILCVLTGFLMAVPVLARYHYQSIYEKQRFQDSVAYMEYMIYAFLRTPKILGALEESHKLCSKGIRPWMEKAMDRIRYAQEYEDLYQDALKNIEQIYGCNRMKELHRFFIQVEQQGGVYQHSLNLLLDDIRQWTEMVGELQQERRKLQQKVTLSVCLSMATAITMVSLLPEDIGDITENPLYQYSSVIFVLCSLGIYLLSRKNLVRSWLGYEEEEESIQKAYSYCQEHEKKHNRHYGFQERRVKNHIQKEFPVWMRHVILNMQTENVSVAMRKAAAESSYILQTELNLAFAEIEQEPGSMKGYQSFLRKFDLPAIKNIFLMFYSLNEFGAKEAEGQMNALIQRNNRLSEQAERLINEDSLGIFGIYMLCPMVLAAGKLLMDMWVFVQQFLFFYSNVIQ